MTSNQKLNFIRYDICVLSILLVLLLFLGIQQFDFQDELHAQPSSKSGTNDKVVILNFDDGRKTQFTQAKPILDKYGFKATFYVVCKYPDNKKGYMNWTEEETLHKEAHDIASHTMNHANLSDSSKKSLEYQIGKSKNVFRNMELTQQVLHIRLIEGRTTKLS